MAIVGLEQGRIEAMKHYWHKTAGALALIAGAVCAHAQDVAPLREGDVPLTPDQLPQARERGDDVIPVQPGGPMLRSDPRAEGGAPDVLAILAHPDDEIIMAPVLARIAREGGDVTLVFATSGDAGPGVSGMEPGAKLASLREEEGRCAAFALGLDQPIFWQFGDGALARSARNTDEAMTDLSTRIADLAAIENPRVIMTWGPDGGYGHADHRMISNAVTQVVAAMEPETRPDLLYAAFPAEASTNATLTGFEGWARIDPSLVTDRIGYEVVDLDATIAAVDCYQSQFDEGARAALPNMLHSRVWRGTVSFRLAFASAH